MGTLWLLLKYQEKLNVSSLINAGKIKKGKHKKLVDDKGKWWELSEPWKVYRAIQHVKQYKCVWNGEIVLIFLYLISKRTLKIRINFPWTWEECMFSGRSIIELLQRSGVFPIQTIIPFHKGLT